MGGGIGIGRKNSRRPHEFRTEQECRAVIHDPPRIHEGGFLSECAAALDSKARVIARRAGGRRSDRVLECALESEAMEAAIQAMCALGSMTSPSSSLSSAFPASSFFILTSSFPASAGPQHSLLHRLKDTSAEGHEQRDFRDRAACIRGSTESIRQEQFAQAWAGTARTGQRADRSTCSVVLPRSASRKPSRPWVGMTMRSAS